MFTKLRTSLSARRQIDPMQSPPQLPSISTGRHPAPNTALLINPFYPKDPHASYGKHVLTPTLALTSVAAATPPHWQVSIWDENLLQGPPPHNPLPAVVGITVHLTFAKRAYQLADWYRLQGAIVVLGGLHANACPEECIVHADAISLGEGTQTWPVILQDIENHRLQKQYTGSFRTPYHAESAPLRSLLPKETFLTTASLIATRGCHNRCTFCYLSTKGLHMPYQKRRVQQVVDEFQETGEPYGVFTDNNLGSDPKYLRELCRALRPLGKIWSAAVTIDTTDDPSLIHEMALAGCTGVFIGLETLTQNNLSNAKKKSPSPGDYARRIAIFHDCGIQVNASFVFGFDEDRPDVFQTTIDWIEGNRLQCATFHLLTPYPGTPLFKQYEREGRLLHTDWDLYDTAHAVFRPKHMSPEELEEGYRWCYRRLFSHRSIWLRHPQRPIDIPAYLAMSYLYKRNNRLWKYLIRHNLTHTVWKPLVELSRQRHLHFRKHLSKRPEQQTFGLPIYPGT